MRKIKAGSTSQILDDFIILDSTSTTGEGLSGLAYNTAGLQCYYHRNTDSASQAITLADMTMGTYTSGGFKQVDGVNCPGGYQFCPPNAALAPGAESVTFYLQGATNMAETRLTVLLTALDDQDGVRGGQSALPYADSGQPGGLMVLGSNQGDVSVTAQSADTPAIYLLGNGSGAGLKVQSLSGPGFAVSGGANGFESIASNGHGAYFIGGEGGDGARMTTNSTSGAGLRVQNANLGPGFLALAGSGGGDAIYAQSTNGNGFTCSGGSSGVGFLARGGTNGGGALITSGTGGGDALTIQSDAGRGLYVLSFSDAVFLNSQNGHGMLNYAPNGNAFDFYSSGPSFCLQSTAADCIVAYPGPTSVGLHVWGGQTSGEAVRLDTNGSGPYTTHLTVDTSGTTNLDAIAAAVRDVSNSSPAPGSFGEAARNADAKAAVLIDTVGAPANATVSADVAAVKADTGNLVTRITSTLFYGITSLAQWLGLLAGKQSGNSTARTEVRATGAGSGTYDETTDSQEALRDRGDAAWATATGFALAASAPSWYSAPVDVSANVSAIKAKTDNLPASPAAVGSAMTLTLTQAVPTSNTAQTVGDALNAARAQGFGKWSVSGTALTLYAADGTTVVRTFTLDSATAPTQRV